MNIRDCLDDCNCLSDVQNCISVMSSSNKVVINELALMKVFQEPDLIYNILFYVSFQFMNGFDGYRCRVLILLDQNCFG